MSADLAQPGDTDLEVDVDGVTVIAVLRTGQDVYLQLEGGFGGWIDAEDGTWFEMPPGDDVARVERVELALCFPTMSDDLIGEYLAPLERWRDEATPLHLCYAADRLGTLSEDEQHWLPLPYHQFPEHHTM